MPPKKKVTKPPPGPINPRPKRAASQKTELNLKVKAKIKKSVPQQPLSPAPEIPTEDLSAIKNELSPNPPNPSPAEEKFSPMEAETPAKPATPSNAQTIDSLHYGHEDLVNISLDTKIETKYNFMGSELGAGAFGTVYKCIHKETGNIRACKKIPKKEMKSQDMSKVWNEMKILKQLDHPNIIKTYEYFQDELHFYIVTDYCEGGELFDRIISKRQFSENSACKVVKQI
jgi:hypothetical protein